MGTSSTNIEGILPCGTKIWILVLIGKTIFYKLAQRVKCCFWHEKIKFISSSCRVMFFLLYRQEDIFQSEITKITSSRNSSARFWKITHSGPGCSSHEFYKWYICQLNSYVYIIKTNVSLHKSFYFFTHYHLSWWQAVMGLFISCCLT